MENLLHAEIIKDILSRLPVESVLNCRLVCKTWQTLTYHPSFALMHLRRSLMSTTHHHLLDVDDDDDVDKYKNHSSSASSSMVGFVFLICLNYYGGSSKLYYGEYDDDNVNVEEEEEEESTYKTLTMINHPPLQESTFVASCNGLICFTISHHRIDDPVYICNPITREYINLPRFTKKILRGGVMASGFGYHPKTNKYKVVRIYFEHGDDEPLVGQVQVYTLGSGSGWRNKGEIKFSSGVRIAVLANGALHWGDKLGKIVSFDLANEEFYLLPSPPGPPCSDCYFSLPKVLGGFLCVATQEEGECVKVWSLKKTKTKNNGSSSSSSYNMLKKQECCQSWSWSLEFSIKWEGDSFTNNLFCVYDPFALKKSGEVLLLWSNDTFLYCYNLKTSSLEKLGTYAPVTGLGRFGRCQVIPHINSFISLKDYGEDVKVIGSDEGTIDQAPSGDLFLDYFRRADLNQDGLISSVEEAIFFQGFDLPPRVLGQILGAVDPNRNLVLEEEEFYDALKLVSVVQSGKELSPDVVHETLHGPDSAKITAPKIINPAAAATAIDTWPRRCYKVLCGNCRACRPDKFNLTRF